MAQCPECSRRITYPQKLSAVHAWRECVSCGVMFKISRSAYALSAGLVSFFAVPILFLFAASIVSLVVGLALSLMIIEVIAALIGSLTFWNGKQSSSP